MSRLTLEELPSELIFNIFEYLDAASIFRGFYDLNRRFNQLLNHYPSFCVDFRSLSKAEFTHFTQKHLPEIQQQVISLNLSDDDDTPNLSSLILMDDPIIRPWQQLQSLTVHSIVSGSNLIRILQQCYELKELIVIECPCNGNEQYICSQIWTLPKLHSCRLDTMNLPRNCFAQLSTVSNAIKCLQLRNMTFNFEDLAALIEHTPHLQRLKIALVCHDTSPCIRLPVLSNLTVLDLSFAGSSFALLSLFQIVSQLRSLRLRTSSLMLNGHQWTELLSDNLPRLKNFRLAMAFQLAPHDKRPHAIEKFLATYRTNFWLIDHQWFVRFDWSTSINNQRACLYTLPYAFDEFQFIDRFEWKSTSRDMKMIWSYDQVTRLQYSDESCSPPLNYLGRFTSLCHLEMVLPCSLSFLSVIPALGQLRSLDLTVLEDDTVYQQLQMILDRAPKLRLLKFSHLADLDSSLFQLNSPSIRRLDFFTKESMIYSWYFNREQCMALAHSSLGQQCHTLVINFAKRDQVLELIDALPNLRSLAFQCQDDTPARKSTNHEKTDAFLEWLRERSPVSVSYSRKNDQPSIIHAWIR